MKREIFITLCCASLMLLTPLSGVAQENTISNNLPEQPNDVEGLVAQLRVVIDEILEKYGHIPMVSSLCNMILNSLGLIGRIIICIFVWIAIILLGLVFFILAFLSLNYAAVYVAAVIYYIAVTMNEFCYPYKSLISKLPFESIYILTETKDNTNTFDGCPCLNE